MADDPRTRPLVANVILVIAFLALVAIGVFTVLVPELEDEPEPPSGTPAATGGGAEPADVGQAPTP
jgi:hypothetical protein